MTSSLAETLKLKIEHEIMVFNFKPGDRLDECRLADLYGSSRTPVREALRLLAAEGLVSIRPHRGAVVSGLTITELTEMFEMMAIFEGLCARFAARGASEEDIAEIEEAQRKCGSCGEANDVNGYYVANVHFHEAIYRASHNGCLIKHTIGTRNRLGAYSRLQLRRHNRLQESFLEHEEILNAIKGGRPDDAERLMHEHIAGQSGLIIHLIEKLPAHYFAQHAKCNSELFLARDDSPQRAALALAFE